MVFAIIFAIVTSLFGYWVVKRWVVEDRVLFLAGLGFKIAGGLSLGIIYRYYLDGGDTWQYFKAAQFWLQLFYNDPALYLESLFSPVELSGIFAGQYRAVFMVKITSLLMILGGGNYWMTTFYCSILSFTTSWYLYFQLRKMWPKADYWAWYIPLFLFPGFLFWTSGILKECIAFCCVAFLTGYAIRFYQGGGLKTWAVAPVLMCVSILLILKYYVAGVFLPLWMGIIVVRLMKDHLDALKKWHLPVYFVAMFVFFGLATTIKPNLAPSNLMYRVVQNHDDLITRTPENYRVAYRHLNESAESFITNVPKALYAGLFGPQLWDGTNNMFQVIAGFENLLLLLSAFLGLYFAIRKHQKPGFLGLNLIAYSVILAYFLALSNPNFGTLVRLKTCFSPFILMLALYPLFNLRAHHPED